ncbi:hypothetical protein IFR05_000675 [Cadophora sp. M221]|nr:hypothetical protein IFR05_000675 [Cadophora sp. M221]
MTIRVLPLPEQVPQLRYVHMFAAGTEHIANSDLYRTTNVPITCSSGAHGPQIAEWFIMTVLMQSHSARSLLDMQDHRCYGRRANYFQVRDLEGQSLGILGYGSIGRQVSRVAQSFGMKIVVYTATPKATPASRVHHGYTPTGTGDIEGNIPHRWYSGEPKDKKKGLHSFLSHGLDILLISLPSTPETYHLIGAQELEIMASSPNHTFISNVARGCIIDHDALTEVLTRDVNRGEQRDVGEGWLRGAALDVTDPEPLPVDHVLWGLPNVMITPHISGAAIGSVERSLDILNINIGRLGKGEKELLNLVDKKRGY